MHLTFKFFIFYFLKHNSFTNGSLENESRLDKFGFNETAQHALTAHYLAMCNIAGEEYKDHLRIKKKRFEVKELWSKLMSSDDAAIVGLEAWRLQSIAEILELKNLWSSNWNSIIQKEEHPYQLQPEFKYVPPFEISYPRIVIPFNPNLPDENKRRNAAMLDYIGYSGDNVEYITLGEKEGVFGRVDWIENHIFSNASSFISDKYEGHLQATYLPYEFFRQLSEKNINEAVYLENDARPVVGFRQKFDSFLTQLRTYRPDYDIAVLGTIFGEHHTHYRKGSVKMISKNMGVIQLTRAFNAVMFSRKCAQKVLDAGALKPNFLPIDWLFNFLMVELNLDVVWAMQPLFYEESKASFTEFCP